MGEKRKREHANTRRFPRQTHRVPCHFRAGGEEGRGFVIDVSASGLFIQTVARLEVGLQIQVVLEPYDAPAIDLSGVVARAPTPHRSATAVVRSGVGVRLDGAPEAYFKLLMELSDRT